MYEQRSPMVDLAEFCSGLAEPHGIFYSQLGLTRLFESRAGMQGSMSIRLLMCRKTCANVSLEEMKPRASDSD
jgi:hypothetical protein